MTINDCLGYISLKQKEVKKLRARLESLEAENLAFKNQNTVLKYELLLTKARAAEIEKLDEEKQQEGDNLRNRIKDLETEIDQLKSNRVAVSYSELMAIHTADVETINKLNIKIRDLNSTISTLLERVSESDKENQELKKKVQDLNDFIQRI